MSRFAEGTPVPIEKSRAEIEGLVRRYGAEEFISGWKDDAAMVQFRAQGRFVKLFLKLPPKDDVRFTHHPKNPRHYHARARTAEQCVQAWEAEVRRLWRSLLLVIKSKLESVESGIETFEEAFLSWILLPDGSTVGRQVAPFIEQAYLEGRMPTAFQLPEHTEG
jgi:hypothetical protein